MAIKRKFVEVEMPLIEETVEILGPAESLKGKTIKIDLTRRLKGKSTEGIFSIVIDDGKLEAYPKKLALMKSYVRRAMRKSISYVEDSFDIECKDVNAKIKPFLITRKKVSRAIKNNLRKTARDFLIGYSKEKDYLEICNQVFHGELQRLMLPKLKKIYPLSLCEIRVIETKSINEVNKKVKKLRVKKEDIEEVEESDEVDSEEDQEENLGNSEE